MRVLLTDGPFLLAWLGVWRGEPYAPEEESALARTIPAISRRLLVERQLSDGAPRPFESLLTTLDLVAQPVFVVNHLGNIVLANGIGRELLDRDRTVLALCSEVARGAARSVRVRSVTPFGARGLGRHFIVVVSEKQVVLDARMDRATRDLQLTPAEARIFEHLVSGDSAKDIALRVGCAPRTVEVHTTAILKKSRKPTRARLAAWFWTEC